MTATHAVLESPPEPRAAPAPTAGGLRISEADLYALTVTRLGLVTDDEFHLARSMSHRFQLPLEEALSERGRFPLRFLLEQVAAQWGVKYAALDMPGIMPEALHRIGEEYARAHGLVAFSQRNGELSVAMADPRDSRVLEDLRVLSQVRVVPYLAARRDIQRALLLYRGNLVELLKQTAAAQRDQDAGEASATESAHALLQHFLEYAAATAASDIHIEPYEHESLVRFRIDGVLREVLSVPATSMQPLTTHIKAMARMRIDDRRSPQDGRFDGDVGGLALDLRVSSLPTHWGEKIVMRVLAKEYATIDLGSMGLANTGVERIARSLERPNGMILITGPTGCGKSTTLYAMLASLGSERLNLVNISTIEDPVERPLPRVSQVDLNPMGGIDYAAGLRALLRQDPDIIMVGEIRDRDTLEIAVRAALVGRLLLSTLHTNDAPTAIPRLLDMGAEPYLVASTLSLVVAQRLVRKVCTRCRETVADDSEDLSLLRGRTDLPAALAALREDGILDEVNDQLTGLRVFRGRGCDVCEHTGYRGRTGLFEVLEVDDDIRKMILQRRDVSAIRRMAIHNGMRTMFDDGLAKVVLGATTVTEVLRVSA